MTSSAGPKFRVSTRAKARQPRAEADELRANLDAAAPDQIRDALAACVETIGFDLKASDVIGMGLNIALAAAMYLAVEGEGVVQCDDGDCWFDPVTGLELD